MTCRVQLNEKNGAINLNKSAHAGLLINFYLQGDKDDRETRKYLLDCACQAPKTAKELYQTAYNLFKGCLPSNSISKLVKVDGRTVIGLGIESPLEVGLTLHHTYGVPYIPGSALKGLASHYCAQVWGEHNDQFKLDGQYHKVLFGATDESGYIVFNDGWITPESLITCLDVDVMAVHHPEYYRSDKNKPPSDFDDPTPITFLSIKGEFLLVLYCDVSNKQGGEWADLAMKLLLEALENWGVGAKISAGYGRMK